ncbi:hypothetical protein [uncultured Parabacteroides sp.]|nr:hypothetical protein [uncultured Parabacteroides sp.]
MKYTLIITEEAKIEIASFSRAGDKAGAKKVNVLLNELREHPYTGTGKP